MVYKSCRLIYNGSIFIYQSAYNSNCNGPCYSRLTDNSKIYAVHLGGDEVFYGRIDVIQGLKNVYNF